MNSQLLLDNFLETVLEPDKETINYYGVEVPFPSLAQAELNHQFNLNLNNNISPDIFESIIEKVAIDIKLKLEKKYKIYYFLIYNICFLRKNKFVIIQKEKFSIKALNELLFNSEEDINKFYAKIKSYNLN